MFDVFRTRMAALGSYGGEAKRRTAQKIMDAEWLGDPATKPVYVKWVDSGLPAVDDDDEVLYAKYNVKSYHSIVGDEIAYLLQFRLEDMQSRPDIKVGSYIYIPNEMDEYEWWLAWHYDDRPQFRQFSILKCTWTYKWVSYINGKRTIHEALGCPRNQSSYNSGVWIDNAIQVIENQHIMVIPTNDDSKTVKYDTKFLISEPGRYPPLAWKISKVQPSMNGSITRFTMTQEQFDPATDNAELGIADYYSSVVNPEVHEQEEIPTVSDLEIVHSGKPSIKAGGGYKKFTLKTIVDGKLVDVADDVEWSVDDESKLTVSSEKNVVKIKCDNDYSLIGKTFTLTAKNKYNSKSITIEVVGI